jgi:hypothetical protein
VQNGDLLRRDLESIVVWAEDPLQQHGLRGRESLSNV